MRRSDVIKPGMKFHRLTVLHKTDWLYVAPRGEARHKWVCMCDCGNRREVHGSGLLSGQTKSCGCWNDEILRLRSLSQISYSRLYRIWAVMWERCRNKKGRAWHRYGGRGIAVCDEWKQFAGFRRDMGAAYKPGLSLDRIDVNGGYAQSNCRWADVRTQANNKKNTPIVTFCGKTQALAYWADELDMDRDLLYRRLVKRGWSVERTMTEAPSASCIRPKAMRGHQRLGQIGSE